MYISNSFCHENFCSCLPGYQASANQTECIVLSLGDNCTSNNWCIAAIPNSACVDGACSCQTGFIHNLSSCLPRKIGDSGCFNERDCRAVPDATCSESGHCQCAPGYKSHLENSECIPRLINDEGCLMNSDCAVLHSNCSNGTCQCQTGYRPDNDFLICNVLQIGDVCNTDTECTVHTQYSECTNDLCTCVPGFSRDGNSCRKTKIEQLKCLTHIDCLQLVQHSECRRDFCRCQYGFYKVSNNTECSRMSIGHTACLDDAFCQSAIPNTVCMDGVCECTKNYNANTINSDCIPMAVTDFACTRNRQCTDVASYTVCNQGKCSCRPGFTMDGMICQGTVIGQSCLADEQCLAADPDSACVTGICQRQDDGCHSEGTTPGSFIACRCCMGAWMINNMHGLWIVPRKDCSCTTRMTCSSD
ncbi:hypothetical protein CAPTEDRAFT_100553 [Capitella teleta]|uniref:EGF-like domain-containing protein n=1 Tax=Capitella teleta TaxID=283909 RepID=R7U2U3_CAPTE|nr:hypothetical protein CAPTEDRAFT_100553 [Capitella teleta]|eukprot:ELU00193.1 hypothetical protein CAPTEDRAFT_100553 [Capitella teleta]